MPESRMLLHVITLALGLIIAFGLQQIVALFQRRSREREARRQINKATHEPDPVDPETPPNE